MRKPFLAALSIAAGTGFPAGSLRAGEAIVVVGDSLCGGDGVSAGQFRAVMLENRLKREGYGCGAVNASASPGMAAGAPAQPRRRNVRNVLGAPV